MPASRLKDQTMHSRFLDHFGVYAKTRSISDTVRLELSVSPGVTRDSVGIGANMEGDATGRFASETPLNESKTRKLWWNFPDAPALK